MPERQDVDTCEVGWYVSDRHARRAIGYLGAALAERGLLPDAYEQPRLLELWGESLGATMDLSEEPGSPIGPDAVRAKELLVGA